MKKRNDRQAVFIRIEIIILGLLLVAGAAKKIGIYTEKKLVSTVTDDYIKWVDFDVSYEVLRRAYELDVETYGKEIHVNWIELLAYVAAKEGGKLNSNAAKEIENTAKLLVSGEKTMEEMTKGMKYYSYYLEAYKAVLDEYVGEYEIQAGEGWEKHYGLKAFSPVAKHFPYNDYDDFGVSRSYGYQRRHLGHDMMGQTGTPIIAVESGTVEALGWNQYGGWRIGIRSFDGKRYYYYAHLRQNYPFYRTLEEGSTVTAGDVIGYMGHTGYSTKENTNNIDVTHLHFGIQLIFDESQKEGNGEIWIDCYDLVRFLSHNRSEVEKEEGTKDWKRIYEMKELGI